MKTTLFVLFVILYLATTLIGCGTFQPKIEDRIVIHMLARHGDIGTKVWETRHSNTGIYEVAQESGLYSDREIYGWKYSRIVSDLTDGMYSWFPFRNQCIGIAHSRFHNDGKGNPKLFETLILYCKNNNIEVTDKEYKRLQRKCGL